MQFYNKNMELNAFNMQFCAGNLIVTVSFEEQRKNMIESQVRTNDVSDLALINAMSKVARENFVDEGNQKFAYAELDVKSKSGRTLMKVRDFSKLAQAAKVNSGEKVLIIGGSSGYSAEVFSQIGADVTIVDTIKCDFKNLVTSDLSNLENIADDSFDLIFVDGGVETISKNWFAKLKNNGRLAVINYLTNVGVAQIYVKSNNVVASKNYFEAKPPKMPEFMRQVEFTL